MLCLELRRYMYFVPMHYITPLRGYKFGGQSLARQPHNLSFYACIIHEFHKFTLPYTFKKALFCLF